MEFEQILVQFPLAGKQFESTQKLSTSSNFFPYDDDALRDIKLELKQFGNFTRHFQT